MPPVAQRFRPAARPHQVPEECRIVVTNGPAMVMDDATPMARTVAFGVVRGYRALAGRAGIESCASRLGETARGEPHEPPDPMPSPSPASPSPRPRHPGRRRRRVRRGYTIPLLDLADQKQRQVVVDREPGQYLGHPTTVLLEDGKTILAAYPKGHGKGAIVLKRSTDGGLTWSDRLPVPENWATSQETPTIHRVVDPQGKRRLVLFSGLYPIRMASSEDDGRTWTPLEKIGDFGGIVAMASVERLKNGDYMALFHDDGRFLRGEGKKSKFRVYKTDLPRRRPDLGPAGGHRRAPGRRPLRAGPGPLARRQADRRAAAGEPPQAQLVRDLLRRRGQDLDGAEGVAGLADRRPARRQVRPRRPAVRLVPGHDAREPDEGRLGRLGRHATRTSWPGGRGSTGCG